MALVLSLLFTKRVEEKRAPLRPEVSAAPGRYQVSDSAHPGTAIEQLMHRRECNIQHKRLKIIEDLFKACLPLGG
jgi:phospholipase/lecithinase/hemolysin